MKNYILIFLFIFLIFGCTATSSKEELNAKLLEANNYINSSQFDKAENIYNELIAKYSDYAAPYVHKGAFLYEHKNDQPGAEKLFEIAIQKTDAGYDAYQWMGVLANARSDYTKAINYLEKSIELDRTKPFTYGQAAIAYMDSNQIDKGREYAKKAIELGLDKNNKRILLKIMVNVSTEYLKLKPKTTEDMLDDVIKEDQTIGDAYVVKGIIAVRKLDYAVAQNYYETALEKEPNNVNAYTRLCEVFYLKKELLKSADYCEHALNIDNKKALAYHYNALAYGELGNYQKATENIEKALQLDPNDPDKLATAGELYILKGVEHAKKNESEEMAQALLRSVDFNKEQTPIEVYESLANYYYTMGSIPDAKKFIDPAIKKTNQLDNVNQRRYLYVYKGARKIYNDLMDLDTVKWLDGIIEKLKPINESKDLPLETEVFGKYSHINKTIYLIPMDVDKEFVSDLATILGDKFKFKFEVLESEQTPVSAYYSIRNQYYVELIEDYLEKNIGKDKVFAITSKDITAETTNYVFGNSNGKTGVISIYRFTNEFNNDTRNYSQLFKRALVQSMSTIGKANGLSTSENPRCALAYPHDFEEFKRKEPIFCETNQKELENIYATYICINASQQDIAKINDIYAKYSLER